MTTSFVLKKARVIDNKLAVSEETVTLEWADLKKKLAPSGSQSALLMLRGAKKGCYLGLVPNPYSGQPMTFRLDLNTASKNLNWLIKQNKNFPSQILELWLVVDTVWEDRIIEADGKPDEP